MFINYLSKEWNDRLDNCNLFDDDDNGQNGIHFKWLLNAVEDDEEQNLQHIANMNIKYLNCYNIHINGHMVTFCFCLLFENESWVVLEICYSRLNLVSEKLRP